MKKLIIFFLFLFVVIFVVFYGTSFTGDAAIDEICVDEYLVLPVYGCTDSIAANYDSLANTNNGSCIYPLLLSVEVEDDLMSYEQYMPTSICGEIINYSYYSASFCKEYKLSEWTIYHMTEDRILSDFHANRPAFSSTKNKSGWLYGWRQDPNLNGVDVSPEEYVRSGYDRAHLVPAGDMYFNQTAMDEAYFMTNATPQISHLNRGGLKVLESKFREWIAEFKSIIIISGCTPKITESHIGKSGIPVPKFFYKIFIDPKNKRSIAFLYPNAKVTQDLFDYVVSIDYLESVTGLDFFYKLSDEDELSFEIDTGNKK